MDSSLELAELQIRLYGGQVVESFDESITHIVFDTWYVHIVYVIIYNTSTYSTVILDDRI